MDRVILILLSFLSLKSCLALKSCNESLTKHITICTLDPRYEKGFPDSPPIQPETTLVLYRVADLHEEKSTITLSFMLAVSWNDTRLTLARDHEDE